MLATMMHVLLADNQPKVRSALRFFLKEILVFSVIDEADNGQHLLQLAKTTQPDLILLDWELPGLPVRKLLPDIRQQTPQSHIIVLSSRMEAEQAALTADIDAFISKSIPPDQLRLILLKLKANVNPISI